MNDELIIGDISDHYLVLSENKDLLYMYIGDENLSVVAEYVLDRINVERIYKFLGEVLSG